MACPICGSKAEDRGDRDYGDKRRYECSRCGPFAPALRLLAENKVEVQALIDADYPLSAGLEAMARAAEPGVRKVLLRP